MTKREIMEESRVPYIPESHKQYNLLPRCHRDGGEVFDYPEDLLYDIENEISEDLIPYGYESYDEYYSKLDQIIEKHSDNVIFEKLVELKSKIQEMNQKENWSIVKYLGESDDEDLVIGLTNGQCYYLPTSRNAPEYRGIIDDEEFTTYQYDFSSEEWEIILDPTGIAKKAFEYGDNAELERAHMFSNNHKPELRKDSVCGCFYCLEIFHPSEIKEWVAPKSECDKRGTAICPHCGIDSIIGESSGYPITKEFLEKMQEYWF